jgi:hypothetical protein
MIGAFKQVLELRHLAIVNTPDECPEYYERRACLATRSLAESSSTTLLLFITT